MFMKKMRKLMLSLERERKFSKILGWAKGPHIRTDVRTSPLCSTDVRTFLPRMCAQPEDAPLNVRMCAHLAARMLVHRTIKTRISVAIATMTKKPTR